MIRTITITARWEADAGVWLATSADVPGLVIEAATWTAMIEEASLVLPEFLELSGQPAGKLSLTFRAEQHLDLAGT